MYFFVLFLFQYLRILLGWKVMLKIGFTKIKKYFLINFYPFHIEITTLFLRLFNGYLNSNSVFPLSLKKLHVIFRSFFWGDFFPKQFHKHNLPISFKKLENFISISLIKIFTWSFSKVRILFSWTMFYDHDTDKCYIWRSSLEVLLA